MRMGAGMSLKSCLQMEYRLAVRCCDNDDFHEGVTAGIIFLIKSSFHMTYAEKKLCV